MQTYSFPATISAREIQRGYKKVLDMVKRTKQPVVVMANNKPQAAIISLDTLDKFNKLSMDQELFALIDRIRTRNTDKNLNQALKEITEDVEEARQKIYEETFGSN